MARLRSMSCAQQVKLSRVARDLVDESVRRVPARPAHEHRGPLD